MNPLLRWLRFNLVGAVGMLVQLSTLAVLSRLFPAHYLLDSAAAVELTLLHNFTWHVLYTWRDRQQTSSRGVQLLRFHLSNGLISICGNLLLMRLLVHEGHLPILLANVLAILSCSALNFLAAHTWAFPAPLPGAP